jgi:hypothetical protein
VNVPERGASMNDSTVLHGEGTTTKSKGESGVVAVVGVGAGR